MNILFVCEVDWQRKVVFDMHLLAEAMSLRGHKVYAIDYEDMWHTNNVKAVKEDDVARALPKASVRLIRSYFIRVKGLSRLSAMATHYFKISKVIREKRMDAIVLYSVPTNGLQTLYWARKFGVPVVFRSIDVLNQLVANRALRPTVKQLEKKVYSSVDRILTISPKLSEYVVSLGAKPEKVSVLPMTVDTNLFCPSDSTGRVRQKWGIADDDKVVMFMGTLFDFSGLDEFIFHFPHLVRKVPKAKLLIVGDGKQRANLERIAKMLNLQGRVIITGFEPYQEMPKYINAADVCVNPFLSNPVTRDIFPGKTVQFLACGKPLVMRPLAGVRAVISGEQQGVVYATTNNGIYGAIIDLLESPEQCRELGQNGLRYARQNHSCTKVAEQLDCILADLVKRKVDA